MNSTERVDRAERVIPADAGHIYSALVDAEALVEWLPPQKMSGRIEGFDASVGGGFRMVLSHPPEALASGAGPRGKTTDLDDVVDVTFTSLEPSAKVEWQAIFDAPDPAFAGVMTQTWTLVPVEDDTGDEEARVGVGAHSDSPATRVTIEARGVPDGISVADHEVGLNSSLAQLAEWVLAQSP